MSTKTISQYVTEIKVRSALLKTMPDSDLETFIEIALREYSRLQPEIKVSENNAVITGQTEYTIPSNAIKVVNLWESATKHPVLFEVRTKDNGNSVIIIGDKKQRSTAPIEQQVYYNSPLDYNAPLDGGYVSFDIEYAILQTMATIKETGLDALFYYIQFMAYDYKGSELALLAETDQEGAMESLTDSDPTGASHTIRFSSKLNVSNTYTKLGEAMYKRFMGKLSIPYGARA